LTPALSETHGPDPAGARRAVEHPAFAISTGIGDAGQHVVTVAGELDLSTAPRLREALRLVEAEMGGSARPVELDFSGVTFIDSTALGIIVAAHSRYGMLAGSGLQISAASAVVIRVLEISGLDRLLKSTTPG
jgi:anti-sigma B factor antagonist